MINSLLSSFTYFIHPNVFWCLQNVSPASSKLQHPVTNVNHVRSILSRWAPGLPLVPVWPVSSGRLLILLLDPAQVSSPLKRWARWTFKQLRLTSRLNLFAGLPSAPKDLVAITTQHSAGKLVLSWSPPEDTGGRTDITYNIECQRCEGSVCQACGEKIRYEPTNTGLSDTKVTVSDLDSHLNYTFTVEARSGVSAFAGQAAPRSIRPPSSVTLTTSLHYTGQCCLIWGSLDFQKMLIVFFFFVSIFVTLTSDPPKITNVRLVERTPNSLFLSWDVSPQPRVHSRPVRYQLNYRKKVHPSCWIWLLLI